MKVEFEIPDGLYQVLQRTALEYGVPTVGELLEKILITVVTATATSLDDPGALKDATKAMLEVPIFGEAFKKQFHRS